MGNLNITHADPSQDLKEVLLAAKRRFTRIPKVQELILAGVPTEVIPTYCALSDYTNNKTGICWPKMETLAATLGRSTRTIQRHLHELRELGLVEFVERRRWRGRYSSYTYRVLHVVELMRGKKRASSTTGHTQPLERGGPMYRGTKSTKTPPYIPPSEAYNSLFGKERNLKAEEQHKREEGQRRSEAAKRRSEGYEWLFEV
jgi:DNA-binding transcriptional ArsR family regulator